MNELSDYKDIYIDRTDFKGALTGYIPGDESLLKELGINFGTIKKESMLVTRVFNRSHINYGFLESADISGPLIFIILFSFFLLLNGKIHFGYVYFISLISTLFMFFLLNVMNNKWIDFIKCCSVMGYSLLPVLLYSFLSILMKYLDVWIRVIVALGVSLWASAVSSLIFVNYLEISNKLFLIWYPLFLVYACFTLLAVF
ncbi:protein transport protein Yip1 [Hamiltosporidium tvaerminnensis]|uniref:Protein YIP n=2 Tax=Hamiltosporidium TaxID=1176354 RepID=A0A4Q9LKN4_9MICR|nr:protein transport protein Yip1 [Hamiltosporidium tvaerminnensis]TBU04472.1 protein transport protein Yip1 [Hamiltosporidium magnivora]TBU08839.1 protein transport protein Yip1 [Hamiltosporidium magnivora]TBU11528.1 protein transport protein Yip1 [Hamiltosporidium tvaerminnensis]